MTIFCQYMNSKERNSDFLVPLLPDIPIVQGSSKPNDYRSMFSAQNILWEEAHELYM